MKLKWDRTTISASEVNRYTYCPYQWYFERYYGRSKLFQMSKTKKAEPQIAPTAKTKSKTKKTTAAKTRESHFARGRAYHSKEYQNFRRKQKIFLFCVTITVIILIVCIFILLIK